MPQIDEISNDLVAQKFSILNNFFEPDLLSLLHQEITEIDENNNLKKAGVGRNDDYTIAKEIRKDKIKWLNNNTPAQNLLFEKLENLRVELNKNLMLGLFDFEAHYAVYEKGDFYKKHVDSFKGAKNRVISLVIYLNKEWQEQDGGILNIYEELEDKKPLFSLLPKWENSIIFLSEELPHEVTTSNKTRYSIAIWFRVRDINS